MCCRRTATSVVVPLTANILLRVHWRAFAQRASDFVCACDLHLEQPLLEFHLDKVACLTSADTERSILLVAMQLGNIFNYVFHHSCHLHAPTSEGMT